MVSIKSLLISAALAASAYGRVGGLAAPDTIQAGQNITATLIYRSSLTNWDDFGVIWGLKGKGGDLPEESTIGQFQSYDPIYPNNILKNRTFSVPVSSFQSPGEYILTAAIPYLVGASGTTNIGYYTQNITVTE